MTSDDQAALAFAFGKLDPERARRLKQAQLVSIGRVFKEYNELASPA